MTTTSLDHLLPAPEETLRCAEHARRIEVDPGGTAIRAERVVLVAVPLPWPKPALGHPALAPLVEALEASPVLTRILAHVPDDIGSGPTGGGTTITVFDRVGGSAVERRYVTNSPAESLMVARSLAADGDVGDHGDHGDHGDDGVTGGARPFLTGEYRPARPSVLICTQGSHDVCCGSDGVRLATELRSRADATLAANGGVDRFQLFQVSHTGGHRFAPTAMTLPDGRMWAGLTSALVDQILARTIGAAEVAPRCRGWWGADTGPAQMAERAVFALRGWSLDDVDRRVTVEPGTDGGFHCTVAPAAGTGAGDAADEDWTVELAAGRVVPTIACRQPGGLPAKPALEFDVVSVRTTGPGAAAISRTP